MRKDLCILIPTCDRYLPVARWTQELLARYWSPLPPVFLCGSTASDSLPLECDSRDWILIAANAVARLQAQGFKWVYFILDDQPPVGPCHSEHLNQTLPAYAFTFGAAKISLFGRRPNEKTDAVGYGADFLHLERSLPSYDWKYSLHPGLWSVDHLLTLLQYLVATLPPEQRQSSMFESHREDPDSDVAKIFANATYRVCGEAMAVDPRRKKLDHAAYGMIDAGRKLVSRVMGNSGRCRFDAQFVGFEYFFRGPYPIFWSGAMRKGAPRFLFSNFLLWSGRWRMRREFDQVAKSFAQQRAGDSRS